MFNKIPKFLSIFFLCLFLLAKNVYSSPLVEIVSYPSSAIGGEEFQVSFNTISLTANSSYYSKSISVDSDYDVQTWSNKTSSWLNYNSSWDDMPEFTSNSEGSASATLKIRFKSDINSGIKNIKVRIRKTNSSSNDDSLSILLPVTAATSAPSPTPDPEETESPTSTPTTTLTPTSTSTSIKTPTPKPTKISTPEPTEGVKIEGVLGIQNENISPTPSEDFQEGFQKPKVSILAIVFVILGISFVGFSGFAFFRKKGFNNNKDEKNKEVI